MPSKNSSRRSFIKNTSLAAGSFFIVPRHVLGRGFIAPSDKLNIAGIGAGGKAEVNLPYAWNNGAENIVALCDVDDRMAVNARKRWPDAPYYRDFREMLEKEQKHIDAVIVTTPDHMHAVQVMAAMQLGKHVYVLINKYLKSYFSYLLLLTSYFIYIKLKKHQALSHNSTLY